MSFVLLLAIISMISAELAPAKSDKERQASMFKIPGQDGEEWAALPEVMSKLDFYADSAPASEEDREGQMKLRDSRFWGRLYISGWPQTIQYFRAHFGSSPPIGRKTFVFAEPRDACEPLTNAQHITSDHIILANRGTCTYGTKSKIAMEAGASAIVIINNEAGLDHLPGPDAHDIDFSVSSIPQQEGQLLEAVYDEGIVDGQPFGRELSGYMVPINCENSGARCIPATYEEREFVKTLNHGGMINIVSKGHAVKESDFPMEYLLAHFGTKLVTDTAGSHVVVARPAEACTSIENDIKGKIVLVRRGGCPFVKKAEEIQAAGGLVMMLGNMHHHIVRMGVEPRWKGLSTVIPVVMVSKRSYGIIVAETMSNPDFMITFNHDSSVNGSTWEPIEKLALGEGWPRSDTYVQKKYEDLKEEHKAWPDRLAAVEAAYATKMKALEAAKNKIKSDAGATDNSEL